MSRIRIQNSSVLIHIGVMGYLCACCGCQTSGQRSESFLARSNPNCHAALKLEAKYGVVTGDLVASRRLERIGGRLVRTIQNFQRVCTFKLLDCPRLNAVSLPEGKVYVTRGLYERLTTDDLLAAAIAHELAHIAVQDGMSPRRSRETQLVKELAADARAIQYLNGANIDPHALLDLLQIVSDEQDPAWAKQRIAVLTDRLSTSSLSNAGSYRE